MNRMNRAWLLSVCALVSATPADTEAQRGSPHSGPRDSAFWNSGIERVRATLAVEIEKELLAQRAAWKADELRAHGEFKGVQFDKNGALPASRWSDPASVRLVHITCDWLGYGLPPDPTPPYPHKGQIVSAVNTRRLCASWIPSGALQGKSHESIGIAPSPAQLLPFSERLIAALDSGYRTFPHDDWYLRQLVRVLTENGVLDRANRVALACDTLAAGCQLIRGYTSALSGRAADSEWHFTRALALLSPEHRCEWTNIPAFIIEYQFTNDPAGWCQNHLVKSVNAWWLATPFYSDSVDWRRLEHNMRGVRNAMAMDLSLDVHHNLQLIRGADMVVAMRMRYGWPSHVAYSDERWENEVMKRKWGYFWTPPYPGPEYAPDRVATLPRLGAILSPLAVADQDFDIRPAPGLSVFNWWPPEHFKHPGGTIERVAEQQRALLRRDTTSILLLASALVDGRIDSIGRDPVAASLVFTPRPDSVEILARETTTHGTTVVMHGEMHTPGIAGFEYLVNAHGLAGGRTRFGVEKLPTLAALAPRTCAISDPLLVRADALTGSGIRDAFVGLLGSLTLENPTKLGLIWESYGFVAADTTSIAVQIASSSEVSRLRRAGMALGLMDDPTTSVTIRWSEPQAPAARDVTTARMPIIARQLALDIGKLRAGSYTLVITMEKSGCDAVESERTFVVTR